MTRTLQHQLAEANAAALERTMFGGTTVDVDTLDRLWESAETGARADRPDAAASSSRGDAFARARRRRLRRAAR